MWVFTTEGFVSAVKDWNEPNKLVIRARSAHALSGLRDMFDVEIKHTPSRDYPYRVMVAKAQFEQWLSGEVQAMEYTNFKDAAHSLGDSRYDRALIKVWTAMYESEANDSRAGR